MTNDVGAAVDVFFDACPARLDPILVSRAE